MILAELYFLSSFVATLKMELVFPFFSVLDVTNQLVFFHFVKAQKHF